MNVLKSQKGVTLIEALVTVVIIGMTTSLFVSFMWRYTYQQVLQEQEIIATNLATETHEERFNQIKNQGVTIPFTETTEVEAKGVVYTITTTITETTAPKKTNWIHGLLSQVQVEVSYGAKKHTSSSYVFKKH